MRLVQTDVKRIDVTAKELKDFLDTPPYGEDTRSKTDQIGVVNGLAWTEVGGELLEVEAGVMDGTGKLELTGNLGQVMQESVKAAYTCLRSRARELGIAPDFYKTKDIHVHFPEGAVPKDGPSAGIAITTAMLSALTGRAVRFVTAETVDAVFAHALTLPKKEAAVEHLAVIGSPAMQEVRHGDQL